MISYNIYNTFWLRSPSHFSHFTPHLCQPHILNMNSFPTFRLWFSFCFCFCLWAREFNQGHLCDPEFETTHWKLVDSANVYTTADSDFPCPSIGKTLIVSRRRGWVLGGRLLSITDHLRSCASPVQTATPWLPPSSSSCLLFYMAEVLA